MVATAGQLARSTNIEIMSFAVAGSTSITTGQCVGLDSSGDAVLAGTSGVVARGLFVAIETVDNSAGSAGDLYIRLAGGNTYVYATASEALVVGHAVKSNTSSKVASTTDATVTIGRYIGHENEESAPTDAVADDVIVVRLGL
jgi:hypothetical protein